MLLRLVNERCVVPNPVAPACTPVCAVTRAQRLWRLNSGQQLSALDLHRNVIANGPEVGPGDLPMTNLAEEAQVIEIGAWSSDVIDLFPIPAT
jgi:hypothetical protein